MPESAAPEAAASYQRLMAQDQVRVAFNWTFLTGADSTDPTLAGIWGAFKGSLITMFVTLLISFPVGVLSALYLEEYAPRNRWTDLIEVSISNLAAEIGRAQVCTPVTNAQLVCRLLLSTKRISYSACR